MNKRIQELAEQCWKERPADQLHFDTEKFAELIIKECMARCRADEHSPSYEAAARIADLLDPLRDSNAY